ncbi:hypothetical protein B7486_52445 [cyanobacterium TDX16]|nr:hypothetical protein B7486_52445 [cyanobacterium TDX16]
MSVSAYLSAIPPILKAVVAQIREVLSQDETWENRFTAAREIVDRALADLPPPPRLASVLQQEERFKIALQRSALVTPALAEAVQTVASVAAEDFKRTVAVVTGVPEIRLEQQRVTMEWLRQPMMFEPINSTAEASSPIRTANRTDVGRLDILAPTHVALLAEVAATQPMAAVTVAKQILLGYTPSVFFSLGCIPPNPILKALRLHAEVNLNKLRTCRNIAGLKRQLEPYAASADTTSGLPTIGAGGQLLPDTTVLRPTLYSYATLIERTKQLVLLAAQIESAMLSALEQRDLAAYLLLNARQELRLVEADVQLRSLKVNEAKNSVMLAQLQQARARIQADHYKKLLMDAKSSAAMFENSALAQYREAENFSLLISNLMVRWTRDDIEGRTSVFAITKRDVSEALVTRGIGQALGTASAAVSFASARASLSLLQASYERRKEEWKLQKALAEQDVAIGAQQIAIANDRVKVVEQEKVIAELQSNNAKDTFEFLTTKFTNFDLYDWMGNVLEGVYRFFLQQATAMAKLAENQLAFERQEVPQAYIQADYWVAPTTGTTLSSTDGKAPDRKGLTGSARLLQDIYQLDQYAFATNQRKLQLIKIISLARLDPFAFQQFRETGVLIFETPMELFDRDFPGHYLRLIKRVRTSVIALIPPTQGIHATLSTTGLSRTVIGPEIFQTLPIRRDPESVALTSPSNATGVFELESQSTDMLLPFESIGVDTTWEFRMPKAANQFDYRTIADVLITVEYTALNSFDYRQQVVQTLNPNFSGDMPFSFRNQFADQWYDLHNPDQTTTSMPVRFQTIREDFPPNIETLKIQQVLLYFVRSSGKSFEIPVTYLRFTEQYGQGTVGGSAISVDGVISTRRGNGGSWTPMIGKSPVGEWELALPNTEEMRNRFKNEEIEDILFIITYSGRTPEWPM